VIASLPLGKPAGEVGVFAGVSVTAVTDVPFKVPVVPTVSEAGADPSVYVGLSPMIVLGSYISGLINRPLVGS
jgi:hypothetical protein